MAENDVKRVAAVGGDEVVSLPGRLLLNGSAVESPTSACDTLAATTWSDSQSPDIDRLRVPPNRFLVVGDDLDNSYDRRFYGAIDVSRVRGKPLYFVLVAKNSSHWLRRKVGASQPLEIRRVVNREEKC